MEQFKKAYGDVPEGFMRVGPLTQIAQAIEHHAVDADALFALSLIHI